MAWNKATCLLMLITCGSAMTRHVSSNPRDLDLPSDAFGEAISNQTEMHELTTNHGVLPNAQTIPLPDAENVSTSDENELSLDGSSFSSNGSGLTVSNPNNMPSSSGNLPSPTRYKMLSTANVPISDQPTRSSNENAPSPNRNMRPTNGNMPSIGQTTLSPYWLNDSNRTKFSSNQKSSTARQTTAFSRQDASETAVPLHQFRQLYGCRKLSPCVCETENGARVDLTPLANTNNTPRFSGIRDSTTVEYSWNPCYSFNQDSACQNVAICQGVWGGTDWAYFTLGTEQSADFLVSSDRGLMLQYIGPGGPAPLVMRTSYVQLKCDPTVEGQLTANGEILPLSGVYYLTLVSRYACLTGGGNSTSPTPMTSPAPTPSPTPTPIYSLKTVVDLLFVLTVTAGLGLIVLMLMLAAICMMRARGAGGRGGGGRGGAEASSAKLCGSGGTPELFYTASEHSGW